MPLQAHKSFFSVMSVDLTPSPTPLECEHIQTVWFVPETNDLRQSHNTREWSAVFKVHNWLWYGLVRHDPILTFFPTTNYFQWWQIQTEVCTVAIHIAAEEFRVSHQTKMSGSILTVVIHNENVMLWWKTCFDLWTGTQIHNPGSLIGKSFW